MASSLLQKKRFFCREWVFSKISSCLESRQSAKTSGALIMGGPGCGKTALSCELVWPTVSIGKQITLNKKLLAYYFCQAHDIESLSMSNFILSLVDQLSKSSLIKGYSDKILEKEVQSVLDPELCEKDPDGVFKLVIIQPLSSLPVPEHNVFIIIDSVDESYFQSISDQTTGSKTIAELISNHQQLFPPWLLVMCSARKQSKSVTRLFTGFKKICLDDLRKSYIIKDVQQYILCRLDQEENLRQHLSKETAEMLNLLHIKSNGCFMYLERVLDGVADSFIMLREIKDIPGTLNGLYLWLCQRLFDKNQFDLIRPILNVILAARRPLTEVELFSCAYTRNKQLTSEDFRSMLDILSKVLTEGKDGTKILFHHSFAEWLLDVKHCTQKYLCQASEGHSMLALSFTMHAPTLSPIEVQDFALHISKSSIPEPFSAAHSVLWLLYSGANIADSLFYSYPREHCVEQLLLDAGASSPSPDFPSTKLLTTSLIPSSVVQEQALAAMLESGMTLNSTDSSSRTLLHNAANDGNLNLVKKLISKSANVNVLDSAGHTPLSLAARQGHTDVVIELIQAGSDVNHTDVEGWSVLRSAAWGGHSSTVSALLQHGAKVDQADNDGRTALRAASWGGHEHIVLDLLKAGGSVNYSDHEGRTPLIAAAYMGHPDIVGHLLVAGADVNHEDVDSRTALSVAALCMPTTTDAGRHAAVVATLIDKEAQVDHCDRDGMTPMLVAAYEGRYEVCELLLESDADVDHTDHSGRTALQAAVSMGHASVVSLLLFWGCAVDMIDNDGRTVLCLACQQGNVEVVRQLLDRGLDEMHRDNSGWTPMHFAAFEGHKEVVDALLESGAKVREIDNEGRIPLLLAAQEGHISVIKALVHAGSSVEAKAHDGRTPLRCAASEGHAEVTEYLITEGADINYRDVDCRTTLYVLALENQLVAAEILLKHKANLEMSDLEGRTPLHVAAWQGHTDMVRLLLRHGAPVNFTDTEKRTALQSAAWQGHAAVALLLLQAGAHVDHVCSQGATALCIAAQEGHVDVVRVLLDYKANPNQADQCGRTAAKVALKSGHEEILLLLEKFGGAISDVKVKGNHSASTSGVSTSTTDCHVTSGAKGCGSVTRLRPPSAILNNKVNPTDSLDRSRSSEMFNNSSGNATASNTTSTDQSSGSCEQYLQKTAMIVSFTQQLQRCSSRGTGGSTGSKKHLLPVSKTLTPASEPYALPNFEDFSLSNSPISEVQGSPLQTRPENNLYQNVCSPIADHCFHYAALSNGHHQRVEAPVWQLHNHLQSPDSQYRQTTTYPSSVAMTGSAISMVRSIHSPSDSHHRQRNGIITNPKFTKSATSPGLYSPTSSTGTPKAVGIINMNGYVNQLASIPDSNFKEKPNKDVGKPARPTGLPLKRETHL